MHCSWEKNRLLYLALYNQQYNAVSRNVKESGKGILNPRAELDQHQSLIVSRRSCLGRA